METLEISDDDVVRYTVGLGRTPSNVFSRRAVQQVRCPRCHALPGAPCQGRRGRQRVANHMERCFDRIRLHLAQPKPDA